jgi:hypothetical protein
MMSFGSRTRARAIEMRWHCPPENWCGRRSAAMSGSMPTSSRTWRTFAVRSAGVPIFQIVSGSSTMSCTLRRGFSDEIGSWKIIWMLVRTVRISLWCRVVSS